METNKYGLSGNDLNPSPEDWEELYRMYNERCSEDQLVVAGEWLRKTIDKYMVEKLLKVAKEAGYDLKDSAK